MTHAAAPSLPALRALPAPALPVARLVAGKRAEEVAALVPRLFSLCRAAQAAAVNAALGRPTHTTGIAREILRDHLLKLCITWPKLLGLGARPIPFPVQTVPTPGTPQTTTIPPLDRTERQAMAEAVFGPARTAPATPDDLAAFLASSHGAAPVLSRIARSFGPGEAAAEALPAPTATSIWHSAPVENSTAARHLAHPAMQALEATHGRGPLWRATARLYDIEAALTGTLPALQVNPGRAMVPATRGVYALRIETEGDIVTRLDRVTPTDSLLARDGILDRALATLPAEKTGLAPLMMDILDPCAPVRLERTDA